METNLTLEQEMANSNEFYFLREFTFSSTKFDGDRQELELADNLILVGSAAIVFQLKERSLDAPADQDDNWFQNKVLKKATSQIKNTHAYLDRYPVIHIRNHRNFEFPISKTDFDRIHNLIVYKSARDLKTKSVFKKFHLSSIIGVIQIMPFWIYKKISGVLLTASEIEEYLCFRKELIEKWGERLNLLSEKSLVGQYLIYGDPSIEPSESFAEGVDQIAHEIESWDMSGILHQFFERMYSPGDYYKILREFSILHRNELKEIKSRFTLAMERSEKNEWSIPLRVVSKRTGCGFVFIPMEQKFREKRQIGLVNLTLLHKYEQKIERCIGVCFIAEADGWCLADWCYINEPWTFDSEMEKLLIENPFLPVKEHIVPRFRIES